MITALCLVGVWLIGQIGHTAGFSRMIGLNGVLESVDGAIMDGLWIILMAPVRVFDAGLHDPAGWTTAILTLAVGVTLLAVAVIVHEQASAATQTAVEREQRLAAGEVLVGRTDAAMPPDRSTTSSPEDRGRATVTRAATSRRSTRDVDAAAVERRSAPRPDQPADHRAANRTAPAPSGPTAAPAALPADPPALGAMAAAVRDETSSTDTRSGTARRGEGNTASAAPRGELERTDTETDAGPDAAAPDFPPIVRGLAVLGAALAISVAIWQIAWTLDRVDSLTPWPMPWTVDAVGTWTTAARAVAGIDVLAVLTALTWLLFVLTIPIGRWLRLLAAATTSVALASAMLHAAVTNGAVYGVLRERPLLISVTDEAAAIAASRGVDAAAAPADAAPGVASGGTAPLNGGRSAEGLRLLLGPAEGAASVIIEPGSVGATSPSALIVESTPREPLRVAGRQSLLEFVSRSPLREGNGG